MKNQFNKQKNKPLNVALMLIFSAFAVQLIFFIAASAVALMFDIERSSYYIFSVAAFVSGSIASGFITAQKKREKGMLYGVLYSLPSSITVMLISAAINGFSVDYNILLSLAFMLTGAAAGGVISVNLKPRKIKLHKHKAR